MTNGIEVSRQNRVLRHRVAELEKVIDYWRKRLIKSERHRQYAEEIVREHMAKHEDLRGQILNYQNTISDLVEEIGRLHMVMIVKGTAEYLVMQLRAESDRCPCCGSDDTGPADCLWGDEGGDLLVGVSCGSCGYLDGIDVSQPQPFIRPGVAGSHDSMGDYGLQVASLPWVLPVP